MSIKRAHARSIRNTYDWDGGGEAGAGGGRNTAPQLINVVIVFCTKVLCDIKTCHCVFYKSFM